MKKNIFLIPLLFLTNYVLGQVHEYCNAIDMYESVFLDLCDNNVYILGFRTDYKDIYSERIISNGYYIEKSKDTIILNDQINGYGMPIQKGPDYVSFTEKSWCFMNNITLSYKGNHGYNDGAYDSIYYTIDAYYSLDSLIQERELYRKHIVLNSFQPGIYEVSRLGDNRLIINMDGTYSYPPMSEGTWKREGNLLIFYDKCLGEAFTAFIEDGYIIPKHLFYYSNFKFYLYQQFYK